MTLLCRAEFAGHLDPHKNRCPGPNFRSVCDGLRLHELQFANEHLWQTSALEPLDGHDTPIAVACNGNGFIINAEPGLSSISDLLRVHEEQSKNGIQVVGITCVGVPIGSPAFDTASVKDKTSAMVDDVRKLRVLPDPLIHTRLIKSCHTTLLSYLNGNLPPEVGHGGSRRPAPVRDGLCSRRQHCLSVIARSPDFGWWRMAAKLDMGPARIALGGS